MENLAIEESLKEKDNIPLGWKIKSLLNLHFPCKSSVMENFDQYMDFREDLGWYVEIFLYLQMGPVIVPSWYLYPQNVALLFGDFRFNGNRSQTV